MEDTEMKNNKYEIGKIHLLSILDDLFGKVLSDEEFVFHHKVLGEQEHWLVVDGFLTQDEILEIEEGWVRPSVA